MTLRGSLTIHLTIDKGKQRHYQWLVVISFSSDETTRQAPNATPSLFGVVLLKNFIGCVPKFQPYKEPKERSRKRSESRIQWLSERRKQEAYPTQPNSTLTGEGRTALHSLCLQLRLCPGLPSTPSMPYHLQSLYSLPLHQR